MMIQEQAQGEFNKGFRKSEEFQRDLPEEKVSAFSAILGKFFKDEAEDYKKTVTGAIPDYDGLLKSGRGKGNDAHLTEDIQEIDRISNRKYRFAGLRIFEASEKGEKYPQSSPYMDLFEIQNNDSESHSINLRLMKDLSELARSGQGPADEFISKGVPSMGTQWQMYMPLVLVQQLDAAHAEAKQGIAATHDESEKQAWAKGFDIAFKSLMADYYQARDDVAQDGKEMAGWFKSQEEKRGSKLSKADILKEVHEELSRSWPRPIPPLDQDALQEWRDVPAIEENTFMHNWGWADKLYKSVAVDSFGGEYLLGVYEHKEDAHQAFLEWSREFDDAQRKLKEELTQWSKEEQARLEGETHEGHDMMRKKIEEARMTGGI